MVLSVTGSQDSGANEVLAGLVWLLKDWKIGRCGKEPEEEWPYTFDAPKLFKLPEDSDSLLEQYETVYLLDMAYSLFDTRNTMSKRNKLFAYATVQSRKRKNIFLLKARSFDHFDLRLRRNIFANFSCSLAWNVPYIVVKLEGEITSRFGGIPSCTVCLDYKRLATLLREKESSFLFRDWENKSNPLDFLKEVVVRNCYDIKDTLS